MSDVGPAMELMTVSNQDGGAPSLASIAKQLGVPVEALDATFGVVPIDPAQGLYAVQVRAGTQPSQSGKDYRGPWSNPKIEPFGPVR